MYLKRLGNGRPILAPQSTLPRFRFSSVLADLLERPWTPLPCSSTHSISYLLPLPPTAAIDASNVVDPNPPPKENNSHELEECVHSFLLNRTCSIKEYYPARVHEKKSLTTLMLIAPPPCCRALFPSPLRVPFSFSPLNFVLVVHLLFTFFSRNAHKLFFHVLPFPWFFENPSSPFRRIAFSVKIELTLLFFSNGLLFWYESILIP